MKSTKFRKYKKITNKIVALSKTYEKMSDEELQSQTERFRKQLKNGKKLETILPEAYATIIEADHRILGMKPYYVQILGGVSLFFGNVAEMKTGEGKTLTATMPMYLHGLTGKGNFLITANSYLARRDAEEIGKVYTWLGLSLEIGVPELEEDTVDKEVVYSADIVYTTHSALGFDYLFDNLASSLAEQYIDTFNYVLIDEVDAILLDMAQTPLIISGAPKVQSNYYELADWFVKNLRKNKDYKKSENQKSVWFTETGIKRAEKDLGVEGILTKKWKDLYRHLVLALRANQLLHKDRDYVVDENEIFLLDEVNGRKLAGTKLQAGLHQAIEAKEAVEISKETRSMGSITYQNLFRKFSIISGMTGTAKTDLDEFRETYDLDVIEIPTHLPVVRKDHDDLVYITNKAKVTASLASVKEALKKGRPVLIETGSVSMSNLYSLVLLEHGIPHNLLNATSSAKESWIIAEAGKKGTVTVATSMAGRGTDIKLDEEAKKNGGLLVVGTERMTSNRIDNQLRGRSGRQGEPGDSIFFVSMEDKIVVESAPKWVAKKRNHLLYRIKKGELTEKKPLHKRKYDKLISRSQFIRKNQEVSSRENTLEYDGVVSLQRENIYSIRNEVLSCSSKKLQEIIEFCITQTIEQFVANSDNLNADALTNYVFNHFDYDFDVSLVDKIKSWDRSSVRKFLQKFIAKKMKELNKKIPHALQQKFFKQIVILKAIDTLWVEQSDNLQQLKSIVVDRAWAQHRPIYEFQIEASRSFARMKEEIWLTVIQNLLLSELVHAPDGSIDVDFP